VFLSGKDDIDKVFKLICHFLQKSNLIIVKCYSEIVNEVYDLIFNSKSNLRRIILSTNVSEASITIPNIKFVIDNGFNKILIHDYAQGDVLVKCPISKESAIQRAGRCGRTGPGVCYRMYTKQTYDEIFDSYTVPEILRSDLSRILLLLVNFNIKDIYSLPLIDVPGRKLVDSCYDFLILMEALNSNRKIKALGELILTLGTDCTTGKMIYEGIRRGCSYEMVLLVSILSLESSHILKILNQVRDKQIDFYKFTVQNNDFITLINIFKNNLVDKVISEKCNYHLKRLTKCMQKNLTSNNNQNLIETALLHSLFFNLSKKCDKKYLNLISRMDFNLPRNSTVDENVDYLIYFKNFKARDKNYAYLCMKVDPNLVIRELGNIFENKKEVNYAVKTKRKIVLDDRDLYENFELEEEEVKVKKVKKRRVNI
jgi:HrpA-like RNA helicase